MCDQYLKELASFFQENSISSTKSTQNISEHVYALMTGYVRRISKKFPEFMNNNDTLDAAWSKFNVRPARGQGHTLFVSVLPINWKHVELESSRRKRSNTRARSFGSTLHYARSFLARRSSITLDGR